MDDLGQRAREIVLAATAWEAGINVDALRSGIAHALRDVREADARVMDKFAIEAFHEYMESTGDDSRQYWLDKSDDAKGHATAIRQLSDTERKATNG